ncbi:hypothetical protein L596_020734 [Steinernema carpocapsae]|uniref:Uncharacterized protein n=1 Tax=Steinernema carpocapsae TaxID=34508 RepID=A0A4V6A0Z4_STECR|nr:hypothetical protein L596_020734 [Steinernema carpocapsae]
MYSLGYFPKFPEFTWVIYTENWPAVILDLEYLTPHDRITSFLIDRQPDVIINSGKVDDEDLRKDKNEKVPEFLKTVSVPCLSVVTRST